jgi:hypothetical protein
MILTLALITYPKMNALVAKIKSKRGREDQSLTSSVGAGPRYAEVPTTDDSGSESDFTSTSSTGKPRFISQTYTHKSVGSTAGSNTEGTTGAGTSTKGSSGPAFKSSASQSPTWSSNH